MINEKAVDHIRTYGVHHDTGAGRSKILFDELGTVKDQKAEYVILSGCHAPEGMPQVFRALKNILHHYRVNYTFLSKEYCCGWVPIGQPAVMAKNEEDIAKSKELAQGFVQENFKQAEALGAKTIVLFCAACEPTYSNFKSGTNLEVISYTELLDRYFPGGKLSLEADYYAGCYRFRRRITQTAIDVGAATRVLSKIQGLNVNYLDNSLCCYVPPHMEKLGSCLKTKTIINICTGCYHSMHRSLQHKGEYSLKMLPEVVWESIEVK